MARKLTGEHLERVRAEKESETGRPKESGVEAEKKSLELAISDAEWKIALLNAKIAELQEWVKKLEVQEGQEGEPIALEKPLVIPDYWLKGSKESGKLWEAALLDGRPADFDQVYRRFVGESSPGKAGWLPGDFQHDIRELAKGSDDPRLQEIRGKNYRGWEQDDFQALGELLGISKMPGKSSVETDDGKVFTTIFEDRIAMMADKADDAGGFCHIMREELQNLLKEQGGAKDNEFEDEMYDLISDGYGDNVQTVDFMGRHIATVEPARGDSNAAADFHFDPSEMRKALRDFLAKYELAKVA